MVGGTYYVVTGTWTWEAIWLSLLYACGSTSVLFGKQIDKIDQDATKQARTLAVLLDESQARRGVHTMVCLQYAGCIALVANGQKHWSLLIVLFNLPALQRLLQSYQQAKPPPARGLPGEVLAMVSARMAPPRFTWTISGPCGSPLLPSITRAALPVCLSPRC